MRIPGLKGVSICLLVDGEIANEYEVPDGLNHADPPGVRTTYVEAKPGANFAVQFKSTARLEKPSSTVGIAIDILCDGKAIHRPICERAEIRRSCTRVYDRTNVLMEDGWFDVKFAFGDLVTHGNNHLVQGTEVAEQAREQYASLGTIVVNLTWMGDVTWTGPARHDGSTNVAWDVEASFPEDFLQDRSISNRVVVTNYTALQSPPEHADVDFPFGANPFAEFVFRYRSEDDLQAEGVIPSDGSPVALEDRDTETLSIEDLRVLTRLQRERIELQAAQLNKLAQSRDS